MKTEVLALVKPGQVDILELEVPAPKRGEIVVEVKANGICKGDIGLFKGKFKRDRYPLFHGHEPVGIVYDTGPDVDNLKPGDQVALLGSPTYRRHFVTHASRAIKIPVRVKPEELYLWISEPAACAVNGVIGSSFKPGDRCALIGCGYMGLLVLQSMPREILGELVVIEPSARNRSLARKFGAPNTVDPAKTDPVELARKKGGNPWDDRGGFDVVIEASGAKGTLAQATKMVRRGGILNIFGHHPGKETVPTTDWHMMGLKVLNTAPGFADDFGLCFRGAVALMATGRIDQKPLINQQFPVEKAQQAFESAAARKKGYIKGVLTF